MRNILIRVLRLCRRSDEFAPVPNNRRMLPARRSAALLLQLLLTQSVDSAQTPRRLCPCPRRPRPHLVGTRNPLLHNTAIVTAYTPAAVGTPAVRPDGLLPTQTPGWHHSPRRERRGHRRRGDSLRRWRRRWTGRRRRSAMVMKRQSTPSASTAPAPAAHVTAVTAGIVVPTSPVAAVSASLVSLPSPLPTMPLSPRTKRLSAVAAAKVRLETFLHRKVMVVSSELEVLPDALEVTREDILHGFIVCLVTVAAATTRTPAGFHRSRRRRRQRKLRGRRRRRLQRHARTLRVRVRVRQQRRREERRTTYLPPHLNDCGFVRRRR